MVGTWFDWWDNWYRQHYRINRLFVADVGSEEAKAHRQSFKNKSDGRNSRKRRKSRSRASESNILDFELETLSVIKVL